MPTGSDNPLDTNWVEEEIANIRGASDIWISLGHNKKENNMTENTGFEIKETVINTGYIDPVTGKFVPSDEPAAFVQTGEDVIVEQ